LSLKDIQPVRKMNIIWRMPRKKPTERRLGKALRKKPKMTMPFGLGISTELIKPTGIFRTPAVYPSQIFVA
jgi:hypothetical protein